LIADDHAPTRDDLQRALGGDTRFQVCAVAADAPGAVQAAVRERPDLCLLDVRMPGGGLSAAWEISARLPRAKIVMLTVSGEDADLFAALRAGAEGYLLKSMSFSELPDTLDGVCSGEAALPPTLVSRVLTRFRTREPRWITAPPSGSRAESGKYSSCSRRGTPPPRSPAAWSSPRTRSGRTSPP
jgi:DNA-binding NarL/FixJ family response regulator